MQYNYVESEENFIFFGLRDEPKRKKERDRVSLLKVSANFAQVYLLGASKLICFRYNTSPPPPPCASLRRARAAPNVCCNRLFGVVFVNVRKQRHIIVNVDV